MKKIIKNPIFTFIIGLVFAGSVVGVVAYNYNAKDIKYSPSDKSWNVKTVEDAINSLYNNSGNELLNKLETFMAVDSYNNTTNSGMVYYFTNVQKNNYDYFKVKKTEEENINFCQLRGKINDETVDIDEDAEYVFNDIQGFWVNVRSLSSSQGRCVVKITLYNK